MAHVLELLRAGTALPVGYNEHILKDRYAGYTECHLEGDWLLVYKPLVSEVVIHRTGTHTMLFGKKKLSRSSPRTTS